MGIRSIFGQVVETAGKVNTNIYVMLVSGIALALDYFNVIEYDIGLLAVVLCGIPIIIKAAYALLTKFDLKADLLVSIAIIASCAIGDYLAAGFIALIMSFGTSLENRTTSKAIKGLRSLSEMKPLEADILQKDGTFFTSPVSDVNIGDTIRVLSGGTVPVDGRIVDGHTSIDESMLTGESILAEKKAGDTVLAGSVSRYGSFIMIAESTSEDTSLERMIRLVDSADPGRAKIVKAADRWATWIVIIALYIATAMFLITGDIIRSVTVLVVFCPCAYVLATPTSILAAIANLSRKGVMVRKGDALERMASISVMAFDKTGTITTGELSIRQAVSFDDEYDMDTVLRYAAAAESMSEHPIGRCIASSKETESMRIADSRIVPGKGIVAYVDGKKVCVGSPELLKDNDVEMDKHDILRTFSYQNGGDVIVHVSIDGRFAGIILLSDTVRDDAIHAVKELKDLGIETMMLTGDTEGAARNVVDQVGIDRYRSRCLPDDKLEAIREEEHWGKHVCMIGDGINDVAALRASTVSVAMGKGRDAAIESADLVLVREGIRPLVYTYEVSRKTKRTIHLNLAIATTVNAIALILAMTGILDPITGSLMHNLGSVLVISMSVMLLRWKPKDHNVPAYDGHMEHMDHSPVGVKYKMSNRVL